MCTKSPQHRGTRLLHFQFRLDVGPASLALAQGSAAHAERKLRFLVEGANAR